MGKKINDIMSSLVNSDNCRDIITSNNRVTDTLKGFGTKGGEKYSNFIDTIIDAIFKVK